MGAQGIIIRGRDQTDFLTDAVRAGVTLEVMAAAVGCSREWVRLCLERVGLRGRARQMGRVRALHHAFLKRGYHPAQQVVAAWCAQHGVSVTVVPTQSQRDYSCALLHVGPARTHLCCHMASSAKQFSPDSGRYFYAGVCLRPAPYACYVVSPERIYCLPRWVVRQYADKVYFPELSDGIWEWTRIEQAFLVEPAMGTEAVQIVAQRANLDTWQRTVQAAALRGAREAWQRALRKSHCLAGHALAGSNLYENARGRRGCRACRLEATRRHRLRHTSPIDRVPDP
jgi:hypothetical protein